MRLKEDLLIFQNPKLTPSKIIESKAQTEKVTKLSPKFFISHSFCVFFGFRGIETNPQVVLRYLREKWNAIGYFSDELKTFESSARLQNYAEIIHPFYENLFLRSSFFF